MSEYERLRAALDKKLAADPALRAVVKRIKNGTATLTDSAEYAKVLSHILGRELSASVLDLSDRESIVSKLLHDCYDDINSVCSDIQLSIDEAMGLHLKPQKAAYPEERVQQFSHSLIDPTVKDSVIKRRARAGSETIIKSFHDDFIKKNAQFRTDAGLKCYIIRIGTKCCDWCTEVAGKYEMGDQPDGIFRRHDNCDCTIIYDGQVLRGKQGADGRRSKTWEELPNTNSDYTPAVLSEADARAKEQQNLQRFRGLTNGENSGKIKEREYEFGVPYGKHSINADIDYINSKEYAAKFDNISENESVNLALLDCARESISHRTGTKYEDMYFIHAETGKILAKQINMTYPSGISYNDEINSLLKRAKEENIPLVTIHNHPEGYPPSVDDLNKAFENNTVFGIAAGHNGQVYKYSNPGKKTECADDIHTIIKIRCEGGTDPDRAYKEEFSINGLSYEIIKGE